MECGQFLIFTSLPPVVSAAFCRVRKKGWWVVVGLKEKASEMLSRSDNFRDLRRQVWLRSQDEVTRSAVGFMLGCQPHRRPAATIPLQSFIRVKGWLLGQLCLYPVTAQKGSLFTVEEALNFRFC